MHLNYSSEENIALLSQLHSHIPLTCAKVYRGIQPIQRATCHLLVCVSVSGEKNNILSQEEAEQCSQVAHVVVVTRKVAPIFILNLPLIIIIMLSP